MPASRACPGRQRVATGLNRGGRSHCETTVSAARTAVACCGCSRGSAVERGTDQQGQAGQVRDRHRREGQDAEAAGGPAGRRCDQTRTAAPAERRRSLSAPSSSAPPSAGSRRQAALHPNPGNVTVAAATYARRPAGPERPLERLKLPQIGFEQQRASEPTSEEERPEAVCEEPASPHGRGRSPAGARPGRCCLDRLRGAEFWLTGPAAAG